MSRDFKMSTTLFLFYWKILSRLSVKTVPKTPSLTVESIVISVNGLSLLISSSVLSVSFNEMSLSQRFSDDNRVFEGDAILAER